MALVSSYPSYARSLHSVYEYDLVCSQRTVDILHMVIDRSGELPSRASHLSLFIHTSYRELSAILTKIFVVVKSIFHLFIIPCDGKVQKKQRWIFKVIEVFLLNPLSLIVTTVAAIIRVVSSFFGMLIPCLAARGFKWAEQITVLDLTLKDRVWKKIAPEKLSKRYFKEITPQNAINYFGELHARINQGALNILNKTIDERKTLLRELYQRYTVYIEYIEQFPELYEFVYKKHHEEIEAIKKALPSAKQQLETDSAYLDIDEVSIKIHNLHTLTKERAVETTSAVGSASSGFEFEELLKRKTKFEEALLEQFHYGSSYIPVL